MRLPIDTQHLNFIAVGIPEAVLDFDSKQPRHDPDGRALYSLFGADSAILPTWPNSIPNADGSASRPIAS